MTFKTIFGRTAFLAAALAISLTATSEARAACSDPAAPYVAWSGCDKSGADLSWADLPGADLSGADLSGANLSQTNLRGADLSGADLSNADLYSAELKGANLDGANLDGASLAKTQWTDGRTCYSWSNAGCLFD